MKILLLGATGMIGQGVLRESLLDPGIERVLALGRHKTGQVHEKLCEVVVADSGPKEFGPYGLVEFLEIDEPAGGGGSLSFINAAYSE